MNREDEVVASKWDGKTILRRWRFSRSSLPGKLSKGDLGKAPRG